jgi:hypothetical protein
LFEGIDEKDLYEKLNETMESMGDFFQSLDGGAKEDGVNETDDTGKESNEEGGNQDAEGFFEKMGGMGGMGGIPGMPNIKDLYGHLKTLFDGKIGSLAKELSEEISGDMGQLFGENGTDQPTTTKEIIQNLLKNPEKMTGLIKTVSDKLNTKISNGEISQDELMKEATDILGKMKGMGDGKQFQEMFKNISKMAGLGGKNKFDMNAFQQMSKQSTTREKMKERMLKKKAMELAKQASAMGTPVAPVTPATVDNIKITPTNIPNNYKFSIDGGLDESEITPVPSSSSSNKKKKNKNKK